MIRRFARCPICSSFGHCRIKCRKRRVGLVAETYEQAREIMVFGESGLLNVCPPYRRPVWLAGRRLLVMDIASWASTADKYRKRIGRNHPRHGNG